MASLHGNVAAACRAHAVGLYFDRNSTHVTSTPTPPRFRLRPTGSNRGACDHRRRHTPHKSQQQQQQPTRVNSIVKRPHTTPSRALRRSTRSGDVIGRARALACPRARARPPRRSPSISLVRTCFALSVPKPHEEQRFHGAAAAPPPGLQVLIRLVQQAEGEGRGLSAGPLCAVVFGSARRAAAAR